MQYSMKCKKFIISGAFLCLFMLTASSTLAMIITDSSDFDEDLNSGAYITESTAPSSSFSKELFTSGNETMSGTIKFSYIPYFNFDNTLYFQFVYDMQETGHGQELWIDDIQVSVTVAVSGSTYTYPIWDYDQANFNGSIILNSQAPYTSTPLGTGGDMALYLPVSLFDGFGLLGSDLLTLTVTQSYSDDGKDEWVALNSGNFFDSNDTIDSTVVPIPSAAILLGSAVVGLVCIGRLRVKKPE